MSLDQPEAQDRPDDRPEDRGDESDRAIKFAREHCVDAIHYLVAIMMDPGDDEKIWIRAEDRSRAAIAILEVAGCL